MKRHKYPAIKLKKNNYEVTERVPGERIRTIGVIHIDRSVFKKSKKERELLKIAKSEARIEDKYLHS